MEAVALNPGRLVAAAVIGLVLLLVLIIKFKVQAMVAILIGAIAIGLLAGMPYEQIVTAVNDGIGNTLKGIALLVGLGSMFGAILEVSGGAQTLAVTMVKRFGDQKAAWALGITGLVIAMPVFFDAGLIILIPPGLLSGQEDEAFLSVLCDPAFSGSCGGPCVHSAHTGSDPGGQHVKCGPGLGHRRRDLLRYLCHDRGRTGMGLHLRKEIYGSGPGACGKPGRYG